MLDEIGSKREQIIGLCIKHHVLRLAVFGSSIRDDFNQRESDIDLLVDFEKLSPGEYAENYLSLLSSLVTLFGRKADLVSSRGIRNPYFRQEIEAKQETLYAA